MKYRIQIQKTTDLPTWYYPQYKFIFWPFWFSFRNYSYISYFSNLNEAKEFLNKKIEEEVRAKKNALLEKKRVTTYSYISHP